MTAEKIQKNMTVKNQPKAGQPRAENTKPKVAAQPKAATVAKAPKAETVKTKKGSLQATVYDMGGKKVRDIELSETLFGASWNPNLVHQVVTGMQANARAGRGLAHTKDRGEVRGGGRKPWQQKGTGRARHGSSRSPLWSGGGVTHGPRNEKNYAQRIPKNMRSKALYVALSRKLRDGEVLFIDSISFETPKTADAKKMIRAFAGIKGFEKLSGKKTNAGLIALSGNDANVKKSLRNFSNVEVEEARNLNVVHVLSASYLIIENPDTSLKALEGKMLKNNK